MRFLLTNLICRSRIRTNSKNRLLIFTVPETANYETVCLSYLRSDLLSNSSVGLKGQLTHPRIQFIIFVYIPNNHSKNGMDWPKEFER